MTTHFGQRLRQLRLERGFTSQSQLAEYMGVAPKTITRHEQSAKPPRPTDRTLQAYLQVLQVEAAYFLHGVGEPPRFYRAVGKRCPPVVERYLDSLDPDDPVQAAVRKGLCAFDWQGAGKPSPTEYEVKSLATVLEGWARM
jgi:transcriptional regulator with XRE-family HTH domain